MGVALRGSSLPVCFFRAVDRRRRKEGTAAHSDCSTTCRPPRASGDANTQEETGTQQMTQQGAGQRQPGKRYQQDIHRTLPVQVFQTIAAMRGRSCHAMLLLLLLL
jgi:hypothetical protein